MATDAVEITREANSIKFTGDFSVTSNVVAITNRSGVGTTAHLVPQNKALTWIVFDETGTASNIWLARNIEWPKERGGGRTPVIRSID